MDTKDSVSFEGFSKRAEEICRGTSLMGYYFRKREKAVAMEYGR